MNQTNQETTQDTFEPNDSTTEIDGRVYTHRTKSGYPARIVCTDFVNDDYPTVALVLFPDGFEYTHIFTGKLDYWKDSLQKQSDYDLIKGAKPSVPKTDWSKVKVDTLIWVKSVDGWVRRYFYKYEGGVVWAYNDGCTSFTTEYYTAWSEASLTDPTKG
jgi:hypothetical protein